VNAVPDSAMPTIRPQQWPGGLTRPDMSNEVDRHDHLALTNRYLERDGEPWIPVSGELHYSRVPRDRWAERLRLMRASGITVVASYVFWIHHEEDRGSLRFDGSLDVAGFIREAAEAGLAVVMRIGPWCHGETRNGGLPDWVVDGCADIRCDDPGYLSLVRAWFAALGREIAPLCGPSGPIIGIQLENELYDQPQHILTLKHMARAAGMHAPVWAATGWGGAQLPSGEVLPLFGGYSDGFWNEWDASWDPTFREHFYFSHVWDDPGIGADQRAGDAPPVSAAVLDSSFPPATCELGGGMAAAYHRRPVPAPSDAAAIANVKLGNGSAWQGFYMYAGGTNPPGRDGMAESHRTGYPNDLPRYDYDFHAPIGAAGLTAPCLAPLREHNMFVESFGPLLATLPSTLPQARPRDVYDRETLRWAVRCDDTGGFVFINRHQPHEPLDDCEAAQFRIETQAGSLVFPDAPVAVPAGTIARWPFALSVGGVRLEWATASPLTVLPGSAPTLVLRAHRGIVPRAHWAAGVVATSPSTGRIEAGPFDLPVGEPLRLSCDTGSLTVLVADEEAVAQLWHVQGRLILSPHALWAEGNNLAARSIREPRCSEWDEQARAFVQLTARSATPGRAADLEFALVREPGLAPASYGSRAGRESAPTDAHTDRVAAIYRLALPGHAADDDMGGSADRVLVIDWHGDVAQLRVDGRPVADRFWDGSRWELDIRQCGITADSTVTVHILPMSDKARVGLNAAARARLGTTSGPWCALNAVRYEASVIWRLS
jgi:beta-galactosidase